MRVRVAIVSFALLATLALGFLATRRSKPIGWFTCLSHAGTGSLSIDARGEASVLRFAGSDPPQSPIDAHWTLAWSPDGGTLEGNGVRETRPTPEVRAIATQLVDLAQNPGPVELAGLAIIRANVTLSASCDGEEGRTSLFTAAPTLADCRRTHEVVPEQGRQCYLTWVSATLHRGGPAADALLGRLFRGFDPDN